jgi:hypothetical protein
MLIPQSTVPPETDINDHYPKGKAPHRTMTFFENAVNVDARQSVCTENVYHMHIHINRK